MADNFYIQKNNIDPLLATSLYAYLASSNIILVSVPSVIDFSIIFDLALVSARVAMSSSFSNKDVLEFTKLFSKVSSKNFQVFLFSLISFMSFFLSFSFSSSSKITTSEIS
jgi:hypothetical protein